MGSKKVYFYITIILFAIVLSACGGSTEEKIYNHLEEAVSQEKKFENIQVEITDLENQERELYNTIIELGSDKLDEIKKASQQAIEVIEARSDKIELEQESIHASRDEFEKIDKLIDKLDNEKAQHKARDMYDIMMDRYQTYDKLHKEYEKSLKLDIELYNMLQQEDLKQEELTDHIAKINKSYGKVLKENEKFNESTAKYNELKQEFYNMTDLDVEFDDVPKDHNNKDNSKNNKEDEA